MGMGDRRMKDWICGIFVTSYDCGKSVEIDAVYFL